MTRTPSRRAATNDELVDRAVEDLITPAPVPRQVERLRAKLTEVVGVLLIGARTRQDKDEIDYLMRVIKDENLETG